MINRIYASGVGAILCWLIACGEQPVPASSYQEVSYDRLSALTQEEVHHSLPLWRLDGQCGEFYCFSEVFVPFHPEPGDLRRWLRPKRVKVRSSRVAFTPAYLRNIGGRVFPLGTESERFCHHNLDPERSSSGAPARVSGAGITPD